MRLPHNRIARPVLRRNRPQRRPRPQVVPANLRRDHRSTLRALHHRIVQRDRRRRPKGRRLQPQKVQIRPRPSQGRLRRSQNLRAIAPHLLHQPTRPHNEHPAVPEIRPGGQIARSRRRVRLLHKGRHRTGPARTPHRPRQNRPLADVAVARLRPVRHNPEGHEIPRSRNPGRLLQQTRQRRRLRHQMVRRQQRQNRARVAPQRSQSPNRRRRRRVAALRLQQNRRSLHPGLAQLLSNQKPVLHVADHERRRKNTPRHATKRPPEQRLTTQQIYKLLRKTQTRQRPQTRP